MEFVAHPEPSDEDAQALAAALQADRTAASEPTPGRIAWWRAGVLENLDPGASDPRAGAGPGGSAGR